MSAAVTCRLIEVESLATTQDDGAGGTYDVTRVVDKATGEKPLPGDMFFHPWSLEHSRDALSDYYFAHNASRPPLCVVLPTGTHFVIDGKFYNAEQGYHGGWTVTGEPPLITVAPSINVVGHWHGWLKNGELTT